jgi:hypothetical protein
MHAMLPKLIFRVLIISILSIGLLSWWARTRQTTVPAQECCESGGCKEKEGKKLRADIPIWESISRHLIAIER